QQLFLAFAQVHRRLDNDAAEQVARATAAHRRHALAAQAEEFAGLRFWRNFQLYATFERRHFELTAQRRVGKTDRHFAEQMLAVALENRMFAHRYLHVEIADRTTVRTRFAFTCETNSIAGIDTRRHFHRQRLGFFNHATAITLAARVRDHLALAATVRAGLLYREKALLHANLAGAATGCTGDRRAAFLGAGATAFLAVHQCRHADFCRGALHRFLKADFEGVTQIGAALRAAATTAAAAKDIAEHVAENIREAAIASATKTAGTGAAGAAIDGRVAELVVGGALLLIGKHFISFVRFLEVVLCLFVARIAVRVVLHRHSAIGFLDIGVDGVTRHSQHLVIISFRHGRLFFTAA